MMARGDNEAFFSGIMLLLPLTSVSDHYLAGMRLWLGLQSSACTSWVSWGCFYWELQHNQLHSCFQQPGEALPCHAMWCTPTPLCFPLHVWLFSWHFWVRTVVQAWDMHIDDHLTWIAYIWTHRKKWRVSSPPQSNWHVPLPTATWPLLPSE